jgi:hypothetical protein
MQNRPTPEPVQNDRVVPLSLAELVALALEGGIGFRLEEMLDRIEGGRAGVRP